MTPTFAARVVWNEAQTEGRNREEREQAEHSDRREREGSGLFQRSAAASPEAAATPMSRAMAISVGKR
jgi:hypothetical protein